jgi:uncharacterized protein (DUF924 family)
VADARDIAPSDVLAFWREAGPDRWYARDEGFDAAIRGRYLELWRKAAAGELTAWEQSDDGALALVIVLDQFPRNMFRDEAGAYSSDAMARDVASRAIDRGADTRVAKDLCEFFYLPLMHSEHLLDQLRCVDLCRAAGSADNLKYAEDHAAIIARFGRFPHRNRVLGRAMSAEEQAFLDQGGFSG